MVTEETSASDNNNTNSTVSTFSLCYLFVGISDPYRISLGHMKAPHTQFWPSPMVLTSIPVLFPLRQWLGGEISEVSQSVPAGTQQPFIFCSQVQSSGYWGPLTRKHLTL